MLFFLNPAVAVFAFFHSKVRSKVLNGWPWLCGVQVNPRMAFLIDHLFKQWECYAFGLKCNPGHWKTGATGCLWNMHRELSIACSVWCGSEIPCEPSRSSSHNLCKCLSLCFTSHYKTMSLIQCIGKELLYLHKEQLKCETLFSTLPPNLRQLRNKTKQNKGNLKSFP